LSNSEKEKEWKQGKTHEKGKKIKYRTAIER